jgi:2-dehydropantoate 2-reductase
VGAPHGGENPLAAEVAALLASAGLEAQARADLPSLLWEKLLVNAAINPLTALTGLPNGGLAEDKLLRDLMLAAVAEGAAVAAAEGVALPEDPVRRAVEVCRRTAQNRSSMLQDLDRGRRTEVDAINGFIVRKAKVYGIPAPVNGALYALVKGRERRGPW